jgi:3-hydroxyisobutyrate dehydrogenase-like beta-hydroxyacid dehydrogenase
MKIGFIGLGNLGAPIALNILERGHELYVFNRTISKTEALASKGAIVCSDIASLASQSDIVFSIVSDDAALSTIVQSEDGLLNHLQAGGIHVSMSTILPHTARNMTTLHAQHQLHYLAAPVFGRPETAMARKLNFVLSGEEKIRKQMDSILRDAGAVGIWDFGEEPTAANTVKLCGNFLIASAIEAIGESSDLALKSGVNPQQMWEMLLQTLFNAPVYHNYSNILINKKFEPASFTAKLGLKDLNLVLQQADAVSHTMPLAKLLQENMQNLVDEGRGSIDWSAISLGIKN